ncbi:hypothetical protein NPIL_6031 [Nephila pilipes]|uniref:C2H2-type domain-containing protein n=1 Tax=Nephila pilipes TaxID=299642 RepID=A0A8X6IAV8_NEPPI|nr:hypothetical protein NPIL_6031 [Nephila pilipes]
MSNPDLPKLSSLSGTRTTDCNGKTKSATPVALRTRLCSQLSYDSAAQIGQCKLCPASFSSPTRLRVHLLKHKPNAKRKKALMDLDILFGLPKSMTGNSNSTSQSQSNPPLPIMDTPILISQSQPHPISLFPEDEFRSSQLVVQDVLLSLISSVTSIIDRTENLTHKLSPSNSPCSSQKPSLPLPNTSAPLLTSTPAVVAQVVESPSISPVLRTSGSENDCPTPMQLSLHSTELLPAAFPTPLDAKACSPPSTNSLSDKSKDVIGSPTVKDTSPNDDLKNSILVSDLALSSSDQSDKSTDILDLILSQSSPRLDNEDECQSDHSAPVIPDNSVQNNSQLSPGVGIIQPNSSQNNQPIKNTSYLDALKLNFCKICNLYVTDNLEKHINSHSASKGRTKSRAAIKKLRSTSVINKTTDTPSTSSRTEIENTFRERFPELAVFNKSSSSSENSSPDQDFLLSWLKIPPTGPPTITSFPKREYSLVVKKGLFRCEFCEKAFITKQGVDSHYESVHGVKKKRITAKLFPQGRQEICHFCCHSPQGSQTLADHYRLIHNLEVHSDRTTTSTNTIKISPSNFVCNQPKQRNVSQDFSTVTITPSSNQQVDNSAITTNAEIHPLPDASSEDSSSRICSECGFVAHKMSGLKLHYFRVHHIKKFQKKKTSPPDPEVIDILPNSLDSLNGDSSIVEKPAMHVLPSEQNVSIEDKPSEQPEISKKIKKHVTFKQQNKIFFNQSFNSSSQSDFQPNYREFHNSKFHNNNSITSHTNSNFDSPEASNSLSTSDRHDHPQYPYVSFQNNILKYCFPVPLKINCPMPNCTSSFGTKAWFLTNSSIKKHLNIFHKSPASSVEFSCFFCKKKIKKNPSQHPCLKGTLVIPKKPTVNDSEWTCPICKVFSTDSRLGQQNHLASHKREQIRKDATPLIIPETNVAKKIKKRRKIEKLFQNKEPDSVSSLNGEDEDSGPKSTSPAFLCSLLFLSPWMPWVEVISQML